MTAPDLSDEEHIAAMPLLERMAYRAGHKAGREYERKQTAATPAQVIGGEALDTIATLRAELEAARESAGLAIDMLENGLCAAQLPVAPAIHTSGLKAIIRKARDLLRTALASEGAARE